jgi:hypothetical protein
MQIFSNHFPKCSGFHPLYSKKFRKPRTRELNSFFNIFEKPHVIPSAFISNSMVDKKHVRQHFIPVCYLRGFSGNDKTLYVYDKQISKSYCKAIKKIAYADNLYRIDKKYLNKGANNPIDENYYETEYFAKNIESEYNRILIDIRGRAKEWLTLKILPLLFFLTSTRIILLLMLAFNI